jgi:hypothetical protein
LQYQASDQTSLSGNPNLPIQSSTAKNRGLNIDSRVQFGDDKQYDITNLISLTSLNYGFQGENSIPDRVDKRVFLDFRGRHSQKLQSFAFYSYSENDQGNFKPVNNSASMGFNYSPESSFAGNMTSRLEDNRSQQLKTRSYGGDGAARYRFDLPVGTAVVNYSLRYDKRSQDSATTQINVIGERVTLVGTTFYSLASQHIIPAAIVVSNSTRTQEFVAGTDYLISVIGAETRIQRLIGGAILDGQDLLIDYAYDSGGTFAYRQIDQAVNLSWGFMSYASIYFRYSNSDLHLTSGTPSFQLNKAHSTVYGLRTDFPLKTDFEIVVGGSFEKEDRREVISPAKREAEDIYIQADDPYFGAGNVRLAARRNRVIYGNSLQNSNLRGYDLRVLSRFWSDVELSATASYNLDTGGIVQRRNTEGTLKAQWRYRKLNLNFDLARSNETQGDVKHSRMLVRFSLRRDF